MKPIYDLEERSYQLAKNCRHYIQKLPETLSNVKDSEQVIKTSARMGINCIIIDNVTGMTNYTAQLKISLTEAEKTKYLLRLLNNLNPEYTDHYNNLIYEIEELKKTLSAAIHTVNV